MVKFVLQWWSSMINNKKKRAFLRGKIFITCDYWEEDICPLSIRYIIVCINHDKFTHRMKFTFHLQWIMDHQRNISAKFGFIWWTIFGENWNEMWKNIDDRHKVATITHLDLLAIWAKNRYRFYTNDWIGINLNDQYCNLSVTWIFFLWSHSDIVIINKLTLILKIHMTSLIKTMTLVLKVSTYIITKLAVILVCLNL